jgi:hypothetical protein
MVGMRFEVPQFIEIEDKIIGPFTWKQFIYLAGGVGVAVVFFLSFPIVIFVLFGLPAAILAFLLAFYPVNGRPFSIFLESMVNYYKSTRLFYWRKRSDVVYRGKTTDAQPELPHLPASTGVGSRGIHSLSRKLEMQSLQKDT